MTRSNEVILREDGYVVRRTGVDFAIDRGDVRIARFCGTGFRRAVAGLATALDVGGVGSIAGSEVGVDDLVEGDRVRVVLEGVIDEDGDLVDVDPPYSSEHVSRAALADLGKGVVRLSEPEDGVEADLAIRGFGFYREAGGGIARIYRRADGNRIRYEGCSSEGHSFIYDELDGVPHGAAEAYERWRLVEPLSKRAALYELYGGHRIDDDVDRVVAIDRVTPSTPLPSRVTAAVLEREATVPIGDAVDLCGATLVAYRCPTCTSRPIHVATLAYPYSVAVVNLKPGSRLFAEFDELVDEEPGIARVLDGTLAKPLEKVRDAPDVGELVVLAFDPPERPSAPVSVTCVGDDEGGRFVTAGDLTFRPYRDGWRDDELYLYWG